MDVSPLLSSPSIAQLPTAQAAAAVVEPSQPVAPTTSSSQGGSTGGSTSQQQQGSSGSSGSSSSSVETALQSINNEMASWSNQMQFTIDPDTHRVVVDIIDPKTGKTISTIPSETVLRIAKMITKFQGNAVATAV